MFIFLVISCMLLPVTMLGIGLLWKKSPPRDINGVYGYRTSMSMKNQETWDFAHKYFGRIIYEAGWFTLVFTIIFLIAIRNSKNFENLAIYLVFAQLVVFSIGIFPTEKALRQRFDKKGRRKIKNEMH